MTKEMFSKIYALFTSLIKQEVCGVYCMNASAHLIGHCGGYELELHPDCLMWGDEFVLLQGVCTRFGLACEVHMYNGTIIIR